MGKADPLDAHPRLCLEALTPSGLVPPPEMGPSLFPSPVYNFPLKVGPPPLPVPSPPNLTRAAKVCSFVFGTFHKVVYIHQKPKHIMYLGT